MLLLLVVVSRTEAMLAWVGVWSASARRGVSGLPGDMRMAVSSCKRAASVARQPMRLRRAALGDRETGEVGDLLKHVDERLRNRVRRGKSGEEGVGDLLVNMTVKVAEGGSDGTTVMERRGDVDRDMAARRRVPELDE